MDSQDNELFLAASRRYEQQGGNPIFRAIFTQAGRNRSFRGIVHQKKFRLTFLQLRTPEENEPLGEALTEAIRQGLQQVVQAENINPAQYSLLVAIHSNSFTNIWAQSARNVPYNQEYVTLHRNLMLKVKARSRHACTTRVACRRPRICAY